ncbi:hypothetical protein D3C73_1353050 [compost metagenome]
MGGSQGLAGTIKLPVLSHKRRAIARVFQEQWLGQPIRLLYVQLVEAISEGKAICLLSVILLQIGPGQ